MKKLVFTAIALVAFSGTSMANTKEKKVTIKTIKKIYEQDYCDLVWVRVTNFWMNSGSDMDVAMAAGNNAEELTK